MSEAESRAKGRWVPSFYYYLATIVGLGFLLGGITATLIGVRRAVVPGLTESYSYYQGPAEEGKGLTKAQEQRQQEQNVENEKKRGWSKAIDGAIFSLVGAPVFFWHLRQARRREPELLGHS